MTGWSCFWRFAKLQMTLDFHSKLPRCACVSLDMDWLALRLTYAMFPPTLSSLTIDALPWHYHGTSMSSFSEMIPISFNYASVCSLKSNNMSWSLCCQNIMNHSNPCVQHFQTFARKSSKILLHWLQKKFAKKFENCINVSQQVSKQD